MRVGEKEEIFEVHRKYLSNVPYFSRILFRGFVEGGSWQASLPEDSPAAFERVLQYIYTRQTATRNKPGITDAGIGLDAHKETVLTMETYQLADKLCFEDLANRLIDALRKTYLDWMVGCYEVKLAIGSGSETLRRLTLRRLVFEIMGDGWATCLHVNRRLHT